MCPSMLFNDSITGGQHPIYNHSPMCSHRCISSKVFFKIRFLHLHPFQVHNPFIHYIHLIPRFNVTGKGRLEGPGAVDLIL
ncbi:hypothetical protein FKM82_024113 [Ascaphus truei]